MLYALKIYVFKKTSFIHNHYADMQLFIRVETLQVCVEEAHTHTHTHLIEVYRHMHSPTYITILSIIYMYNNLTCTGIYQYLNSLKNTTGPIYMKKV